MTGRKIIILVMAVSLLVIPFGSSAVAKNSQYPMNNSAELMAADFAVVRPLQIAAFALGTVIYFASLPFSAAGNNNCDAYRMMITEPARMAFDRPLGVF
jgi:hypothetical protein